MFDFKNTSTEPVVSGEYLRKPGYYLATATEPKFIKSEDPSKKSYLSVTFETKFGKVNDKFFISGPALPKLQMLYLALWGQPLDQEFRSEEELANFFIVALNKKTQIPIKVGMEKDKNDRLWARMGFDFVVRDPEHLENPIPLAKFVEKEIEEGDPDYDKLVTVRKTEVAPTTGTIIPPVQSAQNIPAWGSLNNNDDTDNSLPF